MGLAQTASVSFYGPGVTLNEVHHGSYISRATERLFRLLLLLPGRMTALIVR